jgi:hypothetical protein
MHQLVSMFFPFYKDMMFYALIFHTNVLIDFTFPNIF